MQQHFHSVAETIRQLEMQYARLQRRHKASASVKRELDAWKSVYLGRDEVDPNRPYSLGRPIRLPRDYEAKREPLRVARLQETIRGLPEHAKRSPQWLMRFYDLSYSQVLEALD